MTRYSTGGSVSTVLRRSGRGKGRRSKTGRRSKSGSHSQPRGGHVENTGKRARQWPATPRAPAPERQRVGWCLHDDQTLGRRRCCGGGPLWWCTHSPLRAVGVVAADVVGGRGGAPTRLNALTSAPSRIAGDACDASTPLCWAGGAHTRGGRAPPRYGRRRPSVGVPTGAH